MYTYVKSRRYSGGWPWSCQWKGISLEELAGAEAHGRLISDAGRREDGWNAGAEESNQPSPTTTMTTVSPFARSSVFDELRIGGHEQTVSPLRSLRNATSEHQQGPSIRIGAMQIEEMYSVPESFLEIEVRNPQTHGECAPTHMLRLLAG